MKKTTQELLTRALLILLCAALAAGGTFFAWSFAYGRDWRAGGSRDFADSEFARSYVEDCMRYVMRFADWMGLPTAAVAEGYGGPSFGCRLLRDGEPVFDTAAPDAEFIMSQVFYRYEERVVEGSYDEYDRALAYGENPEGPEGGIVVWVDSFTPLPEIPANETYDADPTGEPTDASGEPLETAEPELVLVGIEREYTLEGYLNYPILPYGGLYAEYAFWQLMAALESWGLPLAILCWALAAAIAFALGREAYRKRGRGLGLMTSLPFDALAAGVLLVTLFLSLLLNPAAERALIEVTPSSWLLISSLSMLLHRVISAFLWTAAAAVLLLSGLGRRWRSDEPQLLISRLSAAARVLFPLGLGVMFAVVGLLVRNEGIIAVGLSLLLIGLVFAGLLFRQLRQLQKATERLAAGDLTGQVDAEGFWPGLREHAEALGRIGDGIQTAVDQQLRGERLKTELITNVSHDLKTPVTSIVSCAELLKKPDTAPKQAAEYIEMLDRQCRKLKKLTDDLVEASKASSGAIDVAREPTDVRELVNQSVGEFSERLARRQITPVVTLPEEPCILETDGQLLWRVMDNLLSNVDKYAQSGTRAYIDLTSGPDGTVIALKNISATALNISADTLMERFVRGDASRSTEGSGLGLSIAQSLTRLLGGELVLTVDGDLFKAEIRLAPPAPAPEG